MGKKAKLKKIRRESVTQTESDPTKFVKQIEHQGYNLKLFQRSPEIPHQKTDPQV